MTAHHLTGTSSTPGVPVSFWFQIWFQLGTRRLRGGPDDAGHPVSPVKDVYPLAALARDPLRVEAQCRGRVRVAQLRAHVPEGRAGREELARIRVPQVVDSATRPSMPSRRAAATRSSTAAFRGTEIRTGSGHERSARRDRRRRAANGDAAVTCRDRRADRTYRRPPVPRPSAEGSVAGH